ncbi:MAG: hypothetical protein V7750_07410 [Sneathiella sp.]
MNEFSRLSWSKDQVDALTEIMNIGISVAAKSLSDMVDEEVFLTIPEIRLVSRCNISEELLSQNPEGMSFVFQDFCGSVSGRSALIFPIRKSSNLVKILLKDVMVDEEMTEMEQEALSEVGNVILNACIATIADILHLRMEVEIPHYIRGDAVNVLLAGDDILDHSRANLFCAVNFKTHISEIDGYALFLLELPSVKKLRTSLEQYLQKII